MNSSHDLIGNLVCVSPVRAAFAFFVLSALAVSCRTIKETEYLTITEYVHDTTKVYVHDTTEITSTHHDSVYHYVEKTVYVDTNGVVHEREVEKLTRIITDDMEEFRAKEVQYIDKISELEKKVSEAGKEVLVEKPLLWWQKTLMFLGVLSIVGFLIFVVTLYLKTKH